MVDTILNNFHLEKIFWIIKKKLAFIIIFAVLGGLAGGGFAYLTNSSYYQASISFYVYSRSDYLYSNSVNMSSSDFTLAKNLVSSYTRVLRSNTVLDKVIEATGLPYTSQQLASNIGSSTIDGTSIFYVYVYDADPYNAMAIANAIADIAPDEISRIVKTGGVEVVDYAQLPTSAISSTNMIKFLALGVAGGGGLSAVLFLFFGLLDTTIRRKYELRLMFNIPFLGEVPEMVAPNKKTKVEMILTGESPFVIKESYNSIRTNIMFLGNGEACPIFAFTSAEQNEGKTLNAINVAIGFAQLGKKVLLIDGDMRNPSIGRMLGLKGTVGLSQYLSGITEAENIVEHSENLYVFQAGKVPPNAPELLAGKRMEALLKAKKEEYEMIIIDLPPVGVVTDGLTLANQVTAYMLVVRMGQSKLNSHKSAVLALEQVGANIGGFILNGMDVKSQDYNYRKYNYDYKYGEKK